MFGKFSPRLFLILAAAALLMPLFGCGTGAESFTKLDSNGDGFLTQEELDHTGDNFVTPEELKAEGKTYARSIETFFADGDSVKDRKLDKDEYAKALQGDRMPPEQKLLLVFLVIAIPVPIGLQLGKWLRMPDHGWKIALILLCIAAGAVTVYFGKIRKGIDLSGGVILIYEIDEEATAEQQLADKPDEEEGEDGQPLDPVDQIDSNDLVQQLRRRINPGGVSEIVVRPYGPRQVEIIIPEAPPAEVEFLKRLIQKTGQLEFLIVATSLKHRDLIDKATKKIGEPGRILKDADGNTDGRWVPVGISQRMRGKKQDYRGVNAGDVLRARTGDSQDFQLVRMSDDVRRDYESEKINLKQAMERMGYRDLQVLMWVDPDSDRNVKGQHLRSASAGWDNVGNPNVRFTMNRAGGPLLGRLTSRHQPDTTRDVYYRMAIIMDGEVISAPRLLGVISSNGEITGDFSQEEVDELAGILKAGRLPAVLRKEPISQNQVSALLGDDTIRSGAIAIGLSLLAVLLFMAVYYRFAGMVACAALLLTLLLIVAVMILVKAAFTLPGLAGLVLTVGMSVDANVLIFERIREEIARGGALRMAIRNGFARATTTIVDANLTTLITATVLYVIGTDQIRGFAVTLWLGIVISMFTAIFCSRVVFDIAERRRWITGFSVTPQVFTANWDFLGRRHIAIAGSLLLIAVGLAAVVARGKGIFDIDFNGGTSVQFVLNEFMPIDDVRPIAEQGNLGDVSVTGVHLPSENGEEGEEPKKARPGEFNIYIVNSSITGEGTPRSGDPVNYEPPGETESRKCVVVSVDEDKEIADLKERFGTQSYSGVAWKDFERDGVEIVQTDLKKQFKGKLQMRSMEFELLADADETGGSMPPVPPAGGGGDEPTPPGTDDATSGLLDDEVFSFTSFQDEDAQGEGAAQADGEADDDKDDADDSTPPNDVDADTTSDPDGTATTPGESEGTDASSPDPVAGDDVEVDIEDTEASDDESLVGNTAAKLKFGHEVSADEVRYLVQGAVKDMYGDIGLPPVIVRSEERDWTGAGSARYKEWIVEVGLSEKAAEDILLKIQDDLKETPVWLSSNKIGGQVAQDMQRTAIGALVACLLCIIGYIWFRFQRVAFGLAAVVALVHDVLITLGAIAASLWLASIFGFLLVEEFKISLPIVAALLTIIGYSLNDTIVVFDRIREVRGKNPELTEEMINTSINQTLSRTLLTSVTTLIVVTILYFLGGQAIRGFAFALMVGVLVGTYSSIFVASPSLLWMMKGAKAAKIKGEKSKATV